MCVRCRGEGRGREELERKRHTHRVDAVGRGDDGRVDEEAEKLDDEVHVEEGDDLLAACEGRRRQGSAARDEGRVTRARQSKKGEARDGPTAVYFERMCAIMMTVMIRATMWTNDTPAEGGWGQLE